MAVQKASEKTVESTYPEAAPNHHSQPASEPRGNVIMVSPPRGDLFARVMGFAVFLLGVAIIVGVIWIAYDMFRDPNLGIAGAPKGAVTTADLGRTFINLIFRLALLFLGSISGSLIANKGIHLYFSGLPRKD